MTDHQSEQWAAEVEGARMRRERAALMEGARQRKESRAFNAAIRDAAPRSAR